MKSPIKRADGSTVDIDALASVSDTDRLAMIQDVIDRTFAEDADKWEGDANISLEKIETIINIPRSGA